MWLSKYFVDFVIFSCMGWIYETIFCTIKKKKWENRGFLYGPICPIYGAGAIACEILVDLLGSPQYAFHYTWWQVFIVSFFGSIVLEYSTAWALEKLFHAYWWDYSKMPLNIKGRVCFPCSVGFGFAGMLVVYVIVPFMEHLTGWMSPIQAELFGLIFMAFVAMDTTLTVSALTQFAKSVAAVEDALNSHMTSFVQNVQDGKYAPGLVLEEGKMAVSAALEGASAAREERKLEASAAREEKRRAAANRLAEERERFSRERLEQAYASMGAGARSALSRVQGYRPNNGKRFNVEAHKRELTHTTRMNHALGQIKSRLGRNK
jgi:uncharacterized membrane protein